MIIDLATYAFACSAFLAFSCCNCSSNWIRRLRAGEGVRKTQPPLPPMRSVCVSVSVVCTGTELLEAPLRRLSLLPSSLQLPLPLALLAVRGLVALELGSVSLPRCLLRASHLARFSLNFSRIQGIILWLPLSAFCLFLHCVSVSAQFSQFTKIQIKCTAVCSVATSADLLWNPKYQYCHYS